MFRWGNRSSRLAGWKTHPTILPRSGFELTTCRTPHLQTWSKCPTPLTTRPLGGGLQNVQRPPHLLKGIWSIVNVGNGYELNNNKGKNWLKYIDSAQLEIDGAASLKSVVTRSKSSVRGFIIRSIVAMEAVTWWILQFKQVWADK